MHVAQEILETDRKVLVIAKINIGFRFQIRGQGIGWRARSEDRNKLARFG
jgi:hypothetical protein